MGALFGFSGPPDPAVLARMDTTLAHRGAYAAVTDATEHGSLAYRAKHEPEFRDRFGCGLHVDGDLAIVLAGRVSAPEGAGPILPALLAQYRRCGAAFVDALEGAFVLAVRDRDRFLLARDGAGQRTLYYGLHRNQLFFAIEPKGVLAAPDFPRRLRPAAVAQYLTFSYVPGTGTMLEDLYELPPGHTALFDGGGRVQLKRYFRFERAPANGEVSDGEWVRRFRDGFAQAVRDRLPGDEPVGVFLSGGLDSSIVTAEAARQYPGRLKTYAIHFGKSYPNELEFARAVADRCKTEHEEVLVQPKHFLPRLRQIIWHLDEPIGDPVAMPNFELARHAAREVRWIFNGEGGDPCFGGPKNIPMMLDHWYGGIERDPTFRERRYLASYQRAYEEIPRLLTPEWQRRIAPATDLEGVLTPFFSGDARVPFLSKLRAINIRLKGGHLILPKVERMLGAWGLTPLAPLFDQRLVRFSFEVPQRLLLSRGIEKVVLKRAYRDALPASVIDRPKSGMRVPVHFWFQGELKRFARKILHPKRVREVGIFDERRVRQLLDYNIEEGPGRYGLRLWMLLTFEIWRRIVIEGEAP